MDDLDEFFKQRDERQASERAKAEREQQVMSEQRQRQLQDDKLLHQNGPAEYAALKQAVKLLAEKYATHGFTFEGERVRLGGAELSFSPANVINAKLQNPGVTISPVSYGAIPTDVQRLDLTQAVIDGKILWCPGRPPRLGSPRSSEQAASEIIKMLTKAADGIKPF